MLKQDFKLSQINWPLQKEKVTGLKWHKYHLTTLTTQPILLPNPKIKIARKRGDNVHISTLSDFNKNIVFFGKGIRFSLVGMLFALLLATPSHAQICNPNIAESTPSSRFEVLGNGSEVKDSKTGLIWQRCTLGQTWDATANNGKGNCVGEAKCIYNWQGALAHAQTMGNGYRLPNIKELASIVEVKCSGHAINTSVFLNMPIYHYWSSSPNVNGSGGAAWYMNFISGNHGVIQKLNGMCVRAVRSE